VDREEDVEVVVDAEARRDLNGQTQGGVGQMVRGVTPAFGVVEDSLGVERGLLLGSDSGAE
jgi:hypothetical protein